MEKNSNTKPLPREAFLYKPGTTRQHVLTSICANKTSGSAVGDAQSRPASSDNALTLVQISKRGESDRDSLKHFFLSVDLIITKGWHEGRAIPKDSLFAMLSVTNIVSMYDENGKQVGNDSTSWDIYAASNYDTTVITYWAIDTSGKHVSMFEVPKIGGVLKW